MNWWTTVISILFSGLLGSLITMTLNNKKEKEREVLAYKKQIFQNLVAFRGDITDNYPTTGNFVISLNQVFVAYNDSERVIAAFEMCRKNMSNDNLVTLLKEMAKDIGINYQFANDDLFVMPLLDTKLQNIARNN